MDKKAIEQGLELLNDKLAKMKVGPVVIIIVGGAAILHLLQSRQTTQDIDIVIATNEPSLYRAAKQAIRQVAQEQQFPDHWINDDVSIVTDQIGRPQKPGIWKQYSHLHVYFPELSYLLALKIFAGRITDDRDIKAIAKALKITQQTQAWAIVNTYIPQPQQQMRLTEITEAVQRCFK